jgi:hypothetical protein
VNGANGMLGRLLYTDVKTYLVELLMKQDQMSMSASIESRVPFLDHRLVEFVARLPERVKLRGFKTKHILREAMRGVLPDSILSRPKMGLSGAVRAMDAHRMVCRGSGSAPRSPDATTRVDGWKGRGRAPARPPQRTAQRWRRDLGHCSTWSCGTARSSMAMACRRSRRQPAERSQHPWHLTPPPWHPSHQLHLRG